MTMPPKKPAKTVKAKKPIVAKAVPKPASRPATNKPHAPPKTGAPKNPPVAEAPAKEAAPERYWEAVGRRKTAVSRVRLFPRGEKAVSVNGKPIAEYFPHPLLQKIAAEALDTMQS